MEILIFILSLSSQNIHLLFFNLLHWIVLSNPHRFERFLALILNDAKWYKCALK